MNPGVKRGFAPESADGFVCFGEDVLQKVIRVLVVRRHVVNEAVQTRRVFDHQFVESGSLARLRAFHQLLIWVSSWLVHRLALTLSTSWQTGRQQIRDPASR